MKRYLFFAVIIGMICFHLYAENDALQNTVDALTLPPLVFDIYPGSFQDTKYLLLDGTYLNFEELRARLLAVPGNEKYVHASRGWWIMAITSACIGFSGLVGSLVVRLVPDIPDKNIWETVADCVLIAGGVGGLVGGANMWKNWRRAIKNYNLSVMGIPVS
jgi:hypothetical protein